jgi:drug/metabolite transporter (DMT)-like permease
MSARACIVAALLAAVLFGASTPFAKLLVSQVAPIWLAGLLYLGSGLGLWILRLVRDRGLAPTRLGARDWPWFLAAIAAGGVLGPLLLMYGLTRTAASSASLLLNLEAVFTALLAWLVFGENADRRVVLGMGLIVAGGALLAWSPAAIAAGAGRGALAIVAAALCWGLVAGVTNCALALMLGASPPAPPLVLAAMTLGLLGYGVSLVLFVLALRGLGSARTSAYFSTAPFLGAAVALLLFHDSAPGVFWLSALLMALGLWLHLSERHEHEHDHPAMAHAHAHVHDAHHRHQHDFPWDGSEPHSHQHQHAPLLHRHRHYPDLHHRHGHRR